jgi:predicted MFS family arabinose efflux permease
MPIDTPRQKAPRAAWGMVALLFVYMVLNFADKIIVGLAGVPIMTELNLSPSDFGLLGSSFFFLYSISAVVFGFIINRVPTRWVLPGLALVWALSQFPMLGAVGFATLLVCRVILGAGEGPAFSVAVHSVFKWFPDHQRTLPTAILSQGSSFGVILAVPLLNWIIINKSWHWAFGALGIVGLIWVAVWLVFGREGPLEPKSAPGLVAERRPYARLLLSPTFIGCSLATFGAYWALSLGLTWFTPFIIKGLGFTQQQAGWISVLPWIFGATVSLTAGALSQAMLSRGFTTRAARGVLGAAPLVVGGLLLMLVPIVENSALRLTLVVFGSGLSGAIYVVCPAMLGEFTPVTQRGAILSLYGAIYTLAGIIAPYVMGNIIEGAATPLDGYMNGYRIVATVLILAGVAGLALLWPNSERARVARTMPAVRTA